MKDDDLFWFIGDFFEQFPPGHQLTIVAKHAFNREYAVNFGPASGGPTEAYHVYAGKVTEKARKKDAWWFTAGAALSGVCGGPLRPDVVFFGELLPEGKVERLYREVDRGFDMVISVGTTSVFPYISEPVLRARRAGQPTVEINPGETEISDLVDFRLEMGAMDALVRLWERWEA